MRGLTARTLLFAFTADLIPLYALYALLFAAHGLSTARISALLAIWSATTFLLEIPTGPWADTVSRRVLLILSGVLLTAGFTVWTVFPSFPGFALGFVLWGASTSLRSGTFEALIYDGLAARSATDRYPRLLGYLRAASESAALLGILAAAPLYAWGGYPLVSWSSIAIAGLHTASASTLPSAPKAVAAAAVDSLEDEPHTPAPRSGTSEAAPRSGAFEAASRSATSGAGAATVADLPPISSAGDRTPGPGTAPPASIDDDSPPKVAVPQPVSPQSAVSGAARYAGMLRAGVREALRVRVIRRGVILVALLNGVTAFDEYFALLAGHAGAGPSLAAVLVGLTMVGALAGAALAGRTEGIRPRTMAAALCVAGVLFIGGSLLAGLAAHYPAAMYVLTAVGFSCVGIAYGIDFDADVLASARLQDAIEGPARATITSVSGFVTEVIALLVFAFVAVVSAWLPISVVVALLGVPLLLAGALSAIWRG
ncbi:MFS transporter [Nocardia sp. NPDC088792]|uniref:MFS transporter n=1 Tax=Nocardia sp. NPDC088792 TaxID=3364332 RepID=UPI0037FD9B16